MSSAAGHASPPPGSLTPALAPLRPPRHSSMLPVLLVALLILTIACGWTYLRIFALSSASRKITPYSRGNVQQQPSSLRSADRSVIAAVWFAVIMTLWSLAQTYRVSRSGINCVEREDQYIRDVRFDALWAAGGAASRAATTASASSSSSSSAALVPSSASVSTMIAEDEMLYDLPDLSEFLPGFVLEFRDVCGPGSAPVPAPAPALSPAAAAAGINDRSKRGLSIGGPPAPPSLVLSAQSTPHLLLPTLTSKINGCRRWCTRCSLYKPDRAHHCHHCGRCIKKLDHHCIFISSCIGFHNYKSFLLFIAYAVLGCGIIVADCWWGAQILTLGQSIDGMASASMSAGASLSLLVLFALCGSVVLTLPFFLAFHARIALLEGCTTLEWNEVLPDRMTFLGVDGSWSNSSGGLLKSFLSLFASSSGRTPIAAASMADAHPFRLSCFQNFKQVFGFSIWIWPLPISIYRSNKKIITGGATAATKTAAAAAAANKSIDNQQPSGTASILRSVGRGLDDAAGSPNTGTDVELDELSAVPLLSSLTAAGSPIAAPPLSKSVLASWELARWEATHRVPQEASKFERLYPHPLYDDVSAATAGLDARSSKAARLRRAAQGLLGREESQLLAEWQARGIMFPTHAAAINPQMALWREGKLFKQAQE